ncbi:MAG: phosphatase PAP2 family protein [Chromatiales bacterium]|jgi:membrane-associated phospholipid phosphatase
MLQKTNSLAIYTVTSLVLAWLSYLYWDIRIASYFYSNNTPPVIEWFKFITEFGEGVYWIVPPGLLYLLYRLSRAYVVPLDSLRQLLEYRRDSLMRLAGFVSLSALTSGFLVNVFKLIFARFRPVELFQNDNYGFSWFDTGYRMASFPSGHSATALGVAFALALVFPRYRLVILALGILVLSSRIVLTAHFLSDTIVGAYVGVLTSLWLYRRFYGEITATARPLVDSTN